MLTIKILVALAAVGLGIWLGLPGRYDQTLEELEHNMELGSRHHRKVKRHFTPLAWLQRQVSARSQRHQHRRRGFNLERPEDR